jgi:hypothetical protein
MNQGSNNSRGILLIQRLEKLCCTSMHAAEEQRMHTHLIISAADDALPSECSVSLVGETLSFIIKVRTPKCQR